MPMFVMFSDDSRFVLQPDDKSVRVWREQGTRNRPENVTEHHAFRGERIMVWEWISLRYRTELHIYRRCSVTAVRYRDEVLDPSETVRCSSWSFVRFNG